MGDEPLRVAVGVLRAGDGRILVAERDPSRHQGGRLEFPGGKCEPGESEESALRRELAEELGISGLTMQPLIRVRHDYADRSVELATFLVERWSGEPRGAEGQPVYWLAPEALEAERFPDANRPVVAALRLPPRIVITPDRELVPDSEGLLRGLDAVLARDPDVLVHFRRPDAGSDAWLAAAHGAADVCRSHGARMLVHAGPDGLRHLPDDVGLHLPVAVARDLCTRPVKRERLLSCACHDAAEIEHAEGLDPDFILLGPVLPTRSHPGSAGLGWDGFMALTGGTTRPVYALGGVEPQHLRLARQNGAVGVAGIRAFWNEPLTA